MTNPSKPAKIVPQPGSAMPIYPLTTSHYPLVGPKSLAVKKMPITYCRSITCQQETRNPMILKNVIEGDAREGAMGADGFRSVSEDVRGQTSYNESYFTAELNNLSLLLTKLTSSSNMCLELQIHGNLQNNLPGMQSALQDHAAGLCDVQPGDGRPDRAVALGPALVRRPGLRDGVCAPPRLDQEDGGAFRGQLSDGEEPAECDRGAARQEHAGSVSTRVCAGAAFTRGHHRGRSAGEIGLSPGGNTMS